VVDAMIHRAHLGELSHSRAQKEQERGGISSVAVDAALELSLLKKKGVIQRTNQWTPPVQTDPSHNTFSCSFKEAPNFDSFPKTSKQNLESLRTARNARMTRPRTNLGDLCAEAASSVPEWRVGSSGVTISSGTLVARGYAYTAINRKFHFQQSVDQHCVNSEGNVVSGELYFPVGNFFNFASSISEYVLFQHRVIRCCRKGWVFCRFCGEFLWGSTVTNSTAWVLNTLLEKKVIKCVQQPKGEALFDCSSVLEICRNADFSCFPADSVVDVFGRGPQSLSSVAAGDLIAVAEPGRAEIRYERLLGDFHSEWAHRQLATFIMISHDRGSLNVSANHYVATTNGFTRAIDVHVGDELFAFATDRGSMRASRVMGLSRHVKYGLYAPITFSGNIVVDGVLASTYTSDEFETFLPLDARRKLLAVLGGHDGVCRLMHVLAFPLRAAYALGLPAFVARLAAVDVPGSATLQSVLSATPRSASDSALGSDMPLYVELVGWGVGFVLQRVL
jgi:hypothetical protein